ncbi:MAG: hypothetical protein WBM28_11755 [Burkholderiales bacterium]
MSGVDFPIRTQRRRPGYRGIVTKMSIEYFNKARGTVTAESRPHLPELTVEGAHDFISEINDQKVDLIARAFATGDKAEADLGDSNH